jgi:hypothetical protein
MQHVDASFQLPNASCGGSTCDVVPLTSTHGGFISIRSPPFKHQHPFFLDPAARPAPCGCEHGRHQRCRGVSPWDASCLPHPRRMPAPCIPAPGVPPPPIQLPMLAAGRLGSKGSIPRVTCARSAPLVWGDTVGIWEWICPHRACAGDWLAATPHPHTPNVVGGTEPTNPLSPACKLACTHRRLTSASSIQSWLPARKRHTTSRLSRPGRTRWATQC